MKVTIKKGQLGWRWHMTDPNIGYDGINCGATRFFRTKFFCRLDFKKRYKMLKKKRSHWPELRDVEVG